MTATQQPRETARRTSRIRTACGIATCAALIAVTNTAAGYAATEPVKLRSTTATCSDTSCPGPSRGNNIVAKINLGQNFIGSGLQVTQVCLNFTFDEANPLDPEEELTIVGHGGFLNVGSEPQFSRTLCLQANLDDFQDGKATLDFYAGVGSVTLAGLSVTYVTSPLT